uniref:Uncharacterized protein n=1 Tax=Caenorhabditis japonica TaxID=281687 RepID=A0A8R1EJJ4_CAEJA
MTFNLSPQIESLSNYKSWKISLSLFVREESSDGIVCACVFGCLGEDGDGGGAGWRLDEKRIEYRNEYRIAMAKRKKHHQQGA